MKPVFWLVEIRLKDWKPDLTSGSRTVTYVEVEAIDEYYARSLGFREFEKQIKYSPILRRKMSMHNLELVDCCAPEAVTID